MLGQGFSKVTIYKSALPVSSLSWATVPSQHVPDSLCSVTYCLRIVDSRVIQKHHMRGHETLCSVHAFQKQLSCSNYNRCLKKKNRVTNLYHAVITSVGQVHGS